MKNLAKIYYCTDIETYHSLNEGKVTLSYKGYIKDLINSFGMMN